MRSDGLAGRSDHLTEICCHFLLCQLQKLSVGVRAKGTLICRQATRPARSTSKKIVSRSTPYDISQKSTRKPYGVVFSIRLWKGLHKFASIGPRNKAEYALLVPMFQWARKTLTSFVRFGMGSRLCEASARPPHLLTPDSFVSFGMSSWSAASIHQKRW